MNLLHLWSIMWLIDSCVHVKGLSQMHKDTSHLISHFRLCNKRFKIRHLKTFKMYFVIVVTM